MKAHASRKLGVRVKLFEEQHFIQLHLREVVPAMFRRIVVAQTILHQLGPWHEQVRRKVIVRCHQRGLVAHCQVVVLNGVRGDVSDCHGIRLHRCVESVAVSIVFSSAQLMMEDVNVCRSCDLPEHFHYPDVEHALLAIDKLLSHSCGRDQTGRAATHREEVPHNHQVPELIAIRPLPTESVTNTHSVAAQTNGRNCQLVGHGKVAGLSAELLVNTPDRRASCAWDQNSDIRNHIICFANHQQTVQRRSRTRQLKVFRRRDSEYHRVLNHHGSQL